MGFRDGVRITSGQVEPHRRFWAARTAESLAGGAPLLAVLGDSAAQGVGAPDPMDGWVGQLLRRLEAADGHPWGVVNLAVSGARVRDVLDQQLPALYRIGRPIMTTIAAVGGNDMYRSSRWSIADGFSQLVRALPPPGQLGEGSRTVVTTLPQGLGRRRAAVANRIVTAVAPDRGVEVADLWATTGPPWRGNYAEDNFHPNARGYGFWVEAILPVLRPGA